MNVQKTLLRFLQEQEFLRIGETRPTKVEVRVISATNSDLLAEVKAGTFREDLFYRLNVVNLHLPPLRERRSDIPLLIDHLSASRTPSSAPGWRVSAPRRCRRPATSTGREISVNCATSLKPA